MFNPQHYGLFFTAEHLEHTQRHLRRQPFADAARLLSTDQPSGVAALQWAGLRYKILGDFTAGEIALTSIENVLSGEPFQSGSALNHVADALVMAQTFEMLRDHPAVTAVQVAHWLDWLDDHAATLNRRLAQASYVETTWLALLTMAVGVALERESAFERAAKAFRDVVGSDISPRGYIEAAMKRGDGSAMQRAVMTVEALVLMAEMAAHVGVDLWRYEVRGVSVMTAALYPIYYFYVTDKWTWETISADEVQAVFRQYGGYLELVYRRTRIRDVFLLLQDLRPIVDPYAGGLPTLTHGVQQRPGLFG